MLSTLPFADCAPNPRRPIGKQFRAAAAVAVDVVALIVETDV